MDQKLAPLNSDEMSSLLKKALVEQSLVQNEVMDEIIKERDKALDEARRSIQGTCYTIDYSQNKLKVFDTYTGNEINSIQLPGKSSKYNPDEFDAWGTSAVIVDLEEIQKEGDIPFHKDGLYGLAIKGDKSYLHNPEIEKQNLLAITNQYIFGGVPKNKNSSLPYDMYLSMDNKTLCLSNRDEGNVYIFDIGSNSFIGDINVRQPGSNKTINVAISDINKKIYITDNATPNLAIYEMDSQKLIKKNLGSGILGNISLTYDQKSFFVVITKPEPNLKSFKTDSFQELKSFPLKGDLFSVGDDPCDLLTLSSDHKYIFFMTYLNDPMPFTPVITVIDIEKNKAVKRFSIKDETKPINIAFKEENPLGRVNKTLEELLVERGLFTFNKLRDIKRALMDGNEEDLNKLAKENQHIETETEEGFVDVESQNLDFELRKEEAVHIDGPVPKRVKHVIIPIAANKQIMEILLGSFWQKSEIDLTEFREQEERLKEISDNVRKKLEHYDIDIVNMQNFFEGYALESTIQREYILEMMDEEESAKRQTIKSAPSNCLNCGSPMLGAWECSACGFVYEKPEDALRRQQASLDHLANLNKGNYFVLDSEKGILMELDNYKIPVWEIRKEDLDLKSITEAIRLDNRNTLLVDREGGAIIEVTPRGRIIWMYNPEDKNSLLEHPGNLSILHNNDLLVADTNNHRVMEIDFDGNVVWQYGSNKSSGVDFNSLNLPMGMQKTYDETYLITDSGNNRVIELSRVLDPDTGIYNIKKKWQYGNPENVNGKGEGASADHLNNPKMAFREMSGNTLILDQGNKRILEVDSKNNIVFEYNTENENPDYNISNPTRITRLKNKDILIVGDDKIVEIFIGDNQVKVVWASDIESLTAKTTFRITKEIISKTKAKYGSSSRYMSKFGDANDPMFANDKKDIKKRVNASRYMGKSSDKEAEVTELTEKEKQLNEIIEKRKSEQKSESEKPKVILTKGENVLPLPVLLIDKIDNILTLANRHGDPIWSYGTLDEEKMTHIVSAEVTPQKTILIADDNLVFEIDMRSNKKIWTHKCRAKSASRLKNGNTLITDEKNLKVYEITSDERIVWEYYDEKPASHALRLSNDNTLITYSQEHLVKEIDSDYNIVWSFGEFNSSGNDELHLSYPEHASRLKNGNTLITDTRNSRIIEVSPEKELVWSFSGAGLTKLISPNFATRLKDGNTYIMHSNYRQLLEVAHDGKVIWRLIMPSKK